MLIYIGRVSSLAASPLITDITLIDDVVTFSLSLKKSATVDQGLHVLCRREPEQLSPTTYVDACSLAVIRMSLSSGAARRRHETRHS